MQFANLEQGVQVSGAVLILIAFTLVQLGRWSTQTWRYLVFNFVGSAALAADAWIGSQWGFLLLEGIWALVSLWSIAAKARGQPHR